jgi:hypothetical protein
MRRIYKRRPFVRSEALLRPLRLSRTPGVTHCVTPTRFGPALLDSAVEWALNFVGRIGLA